MTTCPYCKDWVDETGAVCCPTCNAAHHEECWAANGDVCSVYGCKSDSDDILLGCPWCEEVYHGTRRHCLYCNEPLMNSRQCAELVGSHEWRLLPLAEEPNARLAAGFLRSNGVMARISKLAPVSMYTAVFPQRVSLWVAREDELRARNLIREMVDRYTYCTSCGHVLLVEETECSYCTDYGENS